MVLQRTYPLSARRCTDAASTTRAPACHSECTQVLLLSTLASGLRGTRPDTYLWAPAFEVNLLFRNALGPQLTLHILVLAGTLRFLGNSGCWLMSGGLSPREHFSWNLSMSKFVLPPTSRLLDMFSRVHRIVDNHPAAQTVNLDNIPLEGGSRYLLLFPRKLLFHFIHIALPLTFSPVLVERPPSFITTSRDGLRTPRISTIHW